MSSVMDVTSQIRETRRRKASFLRSNTPAVQMCESCMEPAHVFMGACSHPPWSAFFCKQHADEVFEDMERMHVDMPYVILPAKSPAAREVALEWQRGGGH